MNLWRITMRFLWVFILWISVVGCSRQLSARPQVLVIVDTDAPLEGQLAGDSTISADAAVDTLWVEFLDSANKVYDSRHVVVPDALDWPVSFGAAPQASSPAIVHLRIRLFRGSRLIAADPPPLLTIDRLVDISIPDDGVTKVGVILAGACFGAPPVFLEPRTTCTDGTTRGAPTDGVLTGDAVFTATKAGSWPAARETPCPGNAPDGALCIPGGISVLGDQSLAGATDVVTEGATVPERMAALRPFFLDRTEVTIGRFRALASHLVDLPALASSGSEQTECAWLGPDDPTHDALPVNCVSWEAAAQFCSLVGGNLPTEAQWEHAARGRGQARRFPWGNDDPQCCTSAIDASECHLTSAESVGSHLASPSCANLGDVSRDDVLDLGGNVGEWMAGDFHPYDDPCWGDGVLVDPLCPTNQDPQRVSRGGDWKTTLPIAALRFLELTNDLTGFRCAYAAASP